MNHLRTTPTTTQGQCSGWWWQVRARRTVGAEVGRADAAFRAVMDHEHARQHLSPNRPTLRPSRTGQPCVPARTPLAAGCHGTRYVRYRRGWHAYPVRAVRGALGAGRPAPLARTVRGRLIRVACTCPTEAPGRTCQLRVSTRMGTSMLAALPSSSREVRKTAAGPPSSW